MKKIWELEGRKAEEGGGKLLFNRHCLLVYNTK